MPGPLVPAAAETRQEASHPDLSTEEHDELPDSYTAQGRRFDSVIKSRVGTSTLKTSQRETSMPFGSRMTVSGPAQRGYVDGVRIRDARKRSSLLRRATVSCTKGQNPPESDSYRGDVPN